MAMPRLQLAILIHAAASLVLVACAPAEAKRARQSNVTLEDVQKTTPFALLVPKCLPASARAEPDILAAAYAPGMTDYAVHLIYPFRDKASRRGEPDFPAVSITQHRSLSENVVIAPDRSGLNVVLDGRNVILFDGGMGVQWMEQGTRVQIEVFTGNRDDALRVFHSMVSGGSGCALPLTG